MAQAVRADAKMEGSDAEQHAHKYVKVEHPVATLDGIAEVLVQWKCACGAIKGPESDASSPKPGGWV